MNPEIRGMMPESEPPKTDERWESVRRLNDKLGQQMEKRLRHETGMIEFVNLQEQLTDEDIDKAVEVLDEEKKKSRKIVADLRAKLKQLSDERHRATNEALTELRAVEADRIEAERTAPQNETAEALSEIRRLKLKQESEPEEIELSDDDIEIINDSRTASAEQKLEAGFFARGERMDAAHAAGETVPGMELTKEGLVLMEDRSPTKEETRALLDRNELPPDVMETAKMDLANLEREAFNAEHGIALNRGGQTPEKVANGWRDYEKALKENYGVDADEMAVGKETSKWQKLKFGLKSLFSPGFRRTWNAYEKRVHEYGEAKEQANMTRLMIEDPKAYIDQMETRRMSLFALRKGSNVDRLPPGGMNPRATK